MQCHLGDAQKRFLLQNSTPERSDKMLGCNVGYSVVELPTRDDKGLGDHNSSSSDGSPVYPQVSELDLSPLYT